MIWQDHVINVRLYRLEPLIVSHYAAKYAGHRHFGSGDVMCFVVAEQDSTSSCYYFDESDIGHTRLKRK